MKKAVYITIICFVAFCWQSCKEEGRLDHIDGSAPAPAQVMEVTSRAIPGGAVIKYQLPEDPNLSYVKVEFETVPGEVREAKASLYKDSVVIEGYASSGTYPVKIYSVGRNEKMSEPVNETITPLASPIELAFGTLKLDPAFGGVKVMYENAAKGDLAIITMIDTLGGVWLPLQTFYTNSEAGSFSVRGLDTVEMKFGVYLRDRWNNKSEIFITNVKPIFEEFVTKDTWSKYSLESDTDIPAENNESRYGLKGLWDGITSEINWNVFATPHNLPLPMTFTIKLGKTVTISRLVIHHRNAYEGSTPKVFELYGSNEDTPGDDLFGGDWHLLGRFQSKDAPNPIQPSDTEEVKVKGLSFDLEVVPGEIDDPWMPVKYIRFRTMETYKGPAYFGQVIISELTLYGQMID